MSKDRGVLKVSKNSWHGRIYLNWKARGEFKTYGYRENLCHYVRVILIWAPINWFLKRPVHWKKADVDFYPYSIVLITTAVLLYIAMAIQFPLNVLGGTFFGICVVALLIGAFIAIDAIKEKRVRDRRKAYDEAMRTGIPLVVKDEGFFRVLWRFLSAKKGKICPFIEVNGDHA